jgi:PAS domain S-box-containing protein
MNDAACGQEPRLPSFLAGGGALGVLIAAHDWSRTPLGPIEAWPSSLITATGIVVQSAVPMVMLWGADGIMIYNDGYSVFAGGRHPAQLGMKVREGWPEVADFNDNVMKVGLAGGTLAYRDQELTLYRRGRPEQVWMNLDYSPVLDESGRPAGVIAIVIETTERIQAERAREAAETKVGRVLESMAEGFMLLDAAFRVVTINDEGLRYDGRPRERIIGLTHWQAWPGSEDSAPGLLYKQALNERVPVSLEHLYVWPDGHHSCLEMRAYPSGDGLAIFYRDVTERKRAEDRKSALIALGDRLRGLKEPALIAEAAGAVIGETLGIAQAAYAVIHADGDSATVLRPWRRDPDIISLGGRQRFSNFGTYADRLHRGDAVVVEDTMANPLTANRREVFSRAGIRAFINFPLLEDGRMVGMVLAFDDKARPWPEEEVAFLSSVADRTWAALKTAEAEGDLLALNRDLERQVAARTAERDRVWRNSRDLLVTIGADGVFRAVNPAWTAILGHRPEEVVGRSFLDFIWPDDAALTQHGLDNAVSVRNLTNFENRYRHKDGTPRWISWHTSVEDDIVYAYGRHITAEKEQAAALHQAEEALRQSQKMEAVGQLTGGIAHDFNNLLTGISGSLELLQARVIQGRVNDLERYVTAAQGAAKRAAALTHRLLAFSRRQTLDPRTTNINRLIAGMEELIRRTVGPSVETEVVAAGGLWNTLADPNQIENALLNLCINARDAMPDGGRLTIETGNRWLDARAARERDLPPGQYISLCVSDTGTGMTPEVIARAVDPFFTTKPIGMGTGLGLSMIYGFARQSGGQLRLYSEPGQGAMVCLYLPRHHAQEDGDDHGAEQTLVPRSEQGETVLVVDDEPTVRMLVTEVLEELGYRAIEAGDGAAGLRVLQSDTRIDLLITDVGLPGGMNGRQLADAARQGRPRLKVLFITGYAENAVVGNGHLEPGMHVLTKPFAMETLASRIKDIING